MDSNLNDEYKRVLNDMDANMTDGKEKEYAKNKMYELSMIFIDEMQEMSSKYDDKLNALIQKQHTIEEKLKKMRNDIREIQQDVFDYDETTGEEVFEFEIACPYCNHVFVAEVDETKNEVKCPECENLIELDWDGLEDEGYCSGNCGHCHGNEEDYDDSCECGDDCECDDCNHNHKHDEDDDM